MWHENGDHPRRCEFNPQKFGTVQRTGDDVVGLLFCCCCFASTLTNACILIGSISHRDVLGRALRHLVGVLGVVSDRLNVVCGGRGGGHCVCCV